ncbi:MAG TPA: two-component regulator propeller domain-containing protein [Pirellulales bacterium]|nr:two-component regulator propeller domain-containing protein [Pirellulales bacterium]
MNVAAFSDEMCAQGAWPLRRYPIPAACIALILIFLPAGPARALDQQRSLSQAFHRVWQLPQGLPQPTIYAILQTHDGYLWLGTPAGLVRFDGIRFTMIPNCADLSSEKLRIRDLCEDPARHVWIATDGAGLIRYRGEGNDQRYTRASGMPSDDVHCVMAMRDGSVWAGTDKGLVRLGQKLTVFGATQGMPIEDVRAVSQAKDGAIWVGGAGNQVCSFDGTTWTSHQLNSLPAQGTVRALIADKDGTIWLGTTGGLIHLHDGLETHLTTKDGLPDESIYCLFQGADGTLWIGTRSGFSRRYGDEFASFDAADGLSQSNVYAIYEDREGSLWVGTKHGLNQFNDRRTVPYTIREGLPSNNIGALCNDATGGIWVGTLGAGLAHFDGRHFHTITTRDGLASDSIRALAHDSSGQIWVGTDQGIDRVQDGRVVKHFGPGEGLPSREVTSLCVTPAGELWTGTASGVVQLQGERFVFPDDETLARLPVRSLLAQHDGSILVATAAGLLQIVARQIRPFPNAEVAALDIDSMCRGPEGGLFLGTFGHGLWLVNNDRTLHFTTREGLLDDEISGVLIDDGDRVWMASGSGLSFTSRLELVNYDPRRSAQLKTTPFRLSDATRAFEVQEEVQPCILKSADGRVWQSTTRGLIMVDPSRLVRALPPTPVVIEEMVVNGQPRDLRTVGRLSPGSSNVSFEYTALSLVVPVRTAFRYKLDGFDSDWVEAGTRREAFYTNLSPGEYQFLVAARTFDEAKWETGQPVSFTILPHFYQTFWFLPSCAAAVALTIFGAYRLRVRNIKDQMRAVVAERSRIARELHDTLMQGFSGVTMEMQALAARLPRSQERGTLEEIIRDAANCVRDARRSVAGLRHDPSAESGLSAAIAQAARQLTETGDIRLRLNMRNCPRRLPVDVEYNLLRITQEAITNSIKHSGARSIDVTLDGSGRHILLAIEDDGAGFGTVEAPGVRAGHYGIIGMKERATQIGADLRIDSQPGRGTAIRVTLPMPDMPRAAELGTRSPGKEITS